MKTFRRLISRQSAARPPYSRFVLQWHITHQCDHRCAHCYQDSFEASAELSVERLLEIAGQFSRFLASQQTQNADRTVSGQLTITGGEPLMYHDIRALLSRIHSAYPYLHKALLTNGSLIDSAIAEWLAGFNFDFIQLSLEGREATHDALRGAGDHQRVIRALHCLKKANVKTMLSFTAHRHNYREFPVVSDIAKQCGVQRIWSDRCLPLGASSRDDAVLSPIETEEFFRIMQGAAQSMQSWMRKRSEVAMHRALQFLVAGGRPYSCQAGRSLLAVMPDGDVYPCRRMPIRIGNLFEDQIDSIYEESPLLRRLRADSGIPEGCQGCFYAKACRGGLKCLSYSLTGDPFQKDPGCWHDEEHARRLL